MPHKVIVNYPGPHPKEKMELMRQRMADALGICSEDVVCLPDVTVTVVEVPESMVKTREKADKAEAKAAEAKPAETKPPELKPPEPFKAHRENK